MQNKYQNPYRLRITVVSRDHLVSAYRWWSRDDDKVVYSVIRQ